MRIHFKLAFTASLALLTNLAHSVDYANTNAAYKNGDYESALRELMPLADRGDPDAQMLIGYMHEKGQGISANMVEAVNWYRRAASHGNVVAQFNLGNMYEQGIGGLPKDPKEAFHWIELAAKTDFANAQAKLGYYYGTGFSVPVDYKLALYWSATAVKNGYEDTTGHVSYFFQKAVPQETVAFKSYRILSQAKGFDSAAISYVVTSNPQMGLMLSYGGQPAVNAIGKGAVKFCRLLTAPQVAAVLQGAAKLNVTLSQFGVLGGLSGQSFTSVIATLPLDQQEQVIAIKNFVEFVSAVGQGAYYSCDTTKS
ncbi:tetratricopeptide repeat protein [Massilia sp. CT11-137]|uniref:tetratricopeptide repeat protein n=1 Tax=Massilia sp. CT11-137 TaxID=3393901 RepID=UPI0039AFF0C6